MCGIVGAVTQRDVAETLIEGLRRLEYRGYDSAGLAVVNDKGNMTRLCRVGKVQALSDAAKNHDLHGRTGIAHTRWATHGEPSEANAHPHISGNISVVHNGIIENHESLRKSLTGMGYCFNSETDTEVIAHLINWEQKQGGVLSEVVKRVVTQLQGAFAILVLDSHNPDLLVAARSGSPLVVGCAASENFIASDKLALLPITRRFMFLEEGDIAEITCDKIIIFDRHNNQVQRSETVSQEQYDAGDKGLYRHYMQKEIFEQPVALQNTLAGRLHLNSINLDELGVHAELLTKVQHVQIVACGSSYHAGMIARHWFEEFIGLSCDVEIASEFRYRKSVVRLNSLIITLSQSGETADTLAALRLSKESGYLTSLSVCNVEGSSLVRESDMSLITKAGTEIGVASTKAFTTQLAVLLMLVVHLGHLHGMNPGVKHQIIHSLKVLPNCVEQILILDDVIKGLAENFADRRHALFLGRNQFHPVAMEGALKVKELSYIHAEAYAAGELKHGPLALIDADMPVVVVAYRNALLEKLKSNIEEVRARGGKLYIFADRDAGFVSSDGMKVIQLPHVEEVIAPVVYTVPLQLLSYHIGLVKGADIDQPRNLAKSVTVE